VRRTGDTVLVEGDYQYEALHSGNAVQRFWHENKRLTIERLLPPAPGELVLDVGCGSGVVADFLAERGAEVVGIDGNERAIAFARGRFDRPNLTFRLGLVDERFRSDRPVDKIYCLELIEHIYRDQGRTMLSHFLRILRPGGAVFLTTPNYRSLWPVIERLMDALRLAPPLADHQHVEHYHPAKLRALAADAGFVVETLRTTCFAAPWLAPLSHALALRVDRLETGLDLVPGSIVACVLRKAPAA
jgi:2-polyprenyl-3-methyl-5-hydroxy-6-metoxy-1,4-benzoquinol methylase